MITIDLDVPTAKFEAMKTAAVNLTEPDGPLDAVGSYLEGPGMGAVFGSAGYGTWPPVLRGGRPLIATGALAGGFTHSFPDQNSVLITNEGRPKMIQFVQNFGMTIRAKNVPNLIFKIGDRWIKKKEVTIPPRPFFIWFNELQTNARAVAAQRLSEIFKGIIA